MLHIRTQRLSDWNALTVYLLQQIQRLAFAPRCVCPTPRFVQISHHVFRHPSPAGQSDGRLLRRDGRRAYPCLRRNLTIRAVTSRVCKIR